MMIGHWEHGQKVVTDGRTDAGRQCAGIYLRRVADKNMFEAKEIEESGNTQIH